MAIGEVRYIDKEAIEAECRDLEAALAERRASSSKPS